MTVTTDTLHIRIITPKGLHAEMDIQSGRFPGQGGEIGVLPNHSHLVSALKPGVVQLCLSETTSLFFFIPHGTMEVTPDAVTLLVPSIEPSKSIDRKRAEAAFQRAQERLDSAKGIDISRAYHARIRAQERLAVLDLAE